MEALTEAGFGEGALIAALDGGEVCMSTGGGALCTGGGALPALSTGGGALPVGPMATGMFAHERGTGVGWRRHRGRKRRTLGTALH